MCPLACGRESRKGLESALRPKGTEGDAARTPGAAWRACCGSGSGAGPGSSMLLPVHAARREHWGLEGSEATLCDTVAVDTCH